MKRFIIATSSLLLAATLSFTLSAAAQTVPPANVTPDAITAQMARRTIDMTAVLFSLPAGDGKSRPMFDGVPTKDDPNCDKCAPLQLGAVVDNALFSNLQGDVTLSPQGQPQPTPQQRSAGAVRAALALRLHGNSAAVLSTKELELITDRIKERFMSSLIEVRALTLLDPNDPDLAIPAGEK